MKDVLLPVSWNKFFFFHPELFRIGFFMGFLSTFIIVLKIKQTKEKNEFSRRLVWVLYCSMFWTGTNSFIYHPHYTNAITALLAIPQLIASIALAVFMVWRYGIGGNEENDRH